MTRVAAIAGVLLLAVIGVPAAQEAPVEIDVILPQSGFAAFYGKAQVEGLKALEALANRSGGVNGRPVKFIFADDQTNPQVAVQLFNQIAAKHANVVIGPSLTASCSAVLPLAANGPLTYCLSPGAHPPAGSYMLAANVSTADLVSGEAALERLIFCAILPHRQTY